MRTSTHQSAAPTHRHTATLGALVAAFAAVVLSLFGLVVGASAADRVNISITGTLSPANVTVAVGTTVTWTNNDGQQHELRSTSGPIEFRTDTLDPGQSASFTFNTLGTYSYVDHRNTDNAAYHGTITVADAAPATTVAPGGSTPPPTTPPPAPSTASVHLAGARFAPASVTVAVGATVTWINDDSSKHTVTADNASFDSGTLNSGANFTHKFTAPGTYAYGCDFHGNMRGTIVVTAAPGSPPPPPPPATTVPPVTAPPVTSPPATVPPTATAPGTPAPINGSVTIANNTYTPASLTVNVGSTVTWANNDTVTHTISADDHSFASGLVKKATSWSRTFAAAGTFTYFCEIHPDMTGTVIVKAADGTAPPAAAPPSATTTGGGTVTAAGAAGTSTGGESAGASAGAASGSITISDSGFSPASFHVAVGGTVTFANQGKAMHTVTATNGSFDSDMIRSGGTWGHKFTTAGSFTYNCILHPNMRGTIVVGSTAAGGASTNVASDAVAATDQAQAAPETTAAATAAPGDTTIQPVNIQVGDNKFEPSPATVAAGATVTWTLVGAAAHTVTADDQSFNSGLLKPGESFQQTFTTLGSFTYACLVHPGMVGTIEVVPPEQAASQPAATPGTGTSGPQAQQPATTPVTIPATGPPKSAGIWSSTLVGIAAVLIACCALLFALRSFLKVLGSPAVTPTEPATPGDGLTANAA